MAKLRKFRRLFLEYYFCLCQGIKEDFTQIYFENTLDIGSKKFLSFYPRQGRHQGGRVPIYSISLVDYIYQQIYQQTVNIIFKSLL